MPALVRLGCATWQAAKLDPKSREIRAEYERLKAVEGAQKAQEKGMYGNMFARAKPPEEEKPKTIYNSSMTFASSGKVFD